MRRIALHLSTLALGWEVNWAGNKPEHDNLRLKFPYNL